MLDRVRVIVGNRHASAEELKEIVRGLACVATVRPRVEAARRLRHAARQIASPVGLLPRGRRFARRDTMLSRQSRRARDRHSFKAFLCSAATYERDTAARPAPERVSPCMRATGAHLADFITRVELHGAAPHDYERLDHLMASVNFATVMRSVAGIEYKMPSATYFSQSVLKSDDVRNLALTVVLSLGFGYDIITVSGDIAFFLHPTIRAKIS